MVEQTLESMLASRAQSGVRGRLRQFFLDQGYDPSIADAMALVELNRRVEQSRAAEQERFRSNPSRLGRYAAEPQVDRFQETAPSPRDQASFDPVFRQVQTPTGEPIVRFSRSPTQEELVDERRNFPTPRSQSGFLESLPSGPSIIDRAREMLPNDLIGRATDMLTPRSVDTARRLLTPGSAGSATSTTPTPPAGSTPPIPPANIGGFTAEDMAQINAARRFPTADDNAMTYRARQGMDDAVRYRELVDSGRLDRANFQDENAIPNPNRTITPTERRDLAASTRTPPLPPVRRSEPGPSVSSLWDRYNETGSPADFVRADRAMREAGYYDQPVERKAGGAVGGNDAALQQAMEIIQQLLSRGR
jgi:hypothetical protein